MTERFLRVRRNSDNSHKHFPVKLLTQFWNSSIGKKWIVALTGLALIGFVFGHLAGNLQVFAGPEKINEYAAFLHSIPKTLWVMRIGLIVAFVTHLVATISLVTANKSARPEAYAVTKHQVSRLATRRMFGSGLVIVSFVVYHLLHYTLRTTDARFKLLADGGKLASENDVHTMLVLGFQSPLVSAFYLLAVGLLAVHLSHGVTSVFRTLGLTSHNNATGLVKLGNLVGAAVFIGYGSIPVAVLAGFLKLQA